MNTQFRNIGGELIIVQVPNQSTVSDACQILSQYLEIQGYQLLLVSPDENKNYYQDTDSMIDVVKENPHFITYIKCFKAIENYSDKIKQFTKSSNLKIVNYSKFNLLKLHLNYRILKRNCVNHYIYKQYSQVLKNIPSDFQDRVNQIAKFGFLVEDIKESLRLSNYNVQMAINLIISQILQVFQKILALTEVNLLEHIDQLFNLKNKN